MFLLDMLVVVHDRRIKEVLIPSPSLAESDMRLKASSWLWRPHRLGIIAFSNHRLRDSPSEVLGGYNFGEQVV